MSAPLLAHFFQDLRYAFRTLWNSPAFTVVTALTLALGIGANTAMFSIVDSVLLRPLPFKDPGRLVMAGENFAKGPGSGFSPGSLLDWREQNRVFERLAGWAATGFNLPGKDLPERIDGMRVSWDFFQTLGIQPAIGRGFSASDDQPGAARLAVLSYAIWQRLFGGDPAIVGRTVPIDGAACTIIGIMPSRFRFFRGPEVWVPFAFDRASASRTMYFISGVARLKPGVSITQAQAQLDGIVKNIHRADARSAAQWSARVQPLGDVFIVQKERRRLLVLLGAVGFVLLIACANVANLLLARASVRRRELAVRAALGASRWRLTSQLLTESVLLALAGGTLGLLLAQRAVGFLPALVSASLLSGRAEIAVDSRVLAFTFALSLFTGVFFGILPAWRASRLDVYGALKEGGRGLSGGSLHARLRSVFVVAQVALSLVLLVCAGLMIRSVAAMQRVDLGFRRDHLLTMQLAMPASRYAGAAPIRNFYRQVLAAAGSIPGVRSASIGMGQAPWDTPDATAFQLAGSPPAPPSEMRAAGLERVSSGYFRTMRIPLRKGRVFTERDDEKAPLVAVVNQAFVARYLSREEPLGQRLQLKETWRIVGVVADVKFGGPDANSVPMLYLPVSQSPKTNGALALFTFGDPAVLARTVRAAVARIDRDVPATRIRTMDQIALASMSQPRTQTGLMTAFAAMALLLSALGVYGVMSYAVAQGTHDMGIRLALGATARDVLKLVLGHGLALTGAGLLAGLAGALALTRVLSSLLFEVKATDPWTFAAVSLLLACVALAAALIPARRATRVDPVVALRFE